MSNVSTVKKLKICSIISNGTLKETLQIMIKQMMDCRFHLLEGVKKVQGSFVGGWPTASEIAKINIPGKVYFDAHRAGNIKNTLV